MGYFRTFANFISRVKMAKKIQDPNFWYSLLLPYVNWHTRMSYRRFEVHGKENIPRNSAVIFGVNHSNTLMDALVLLAAGAAL